MIQFPNAMKLTFFSSLSLPYPFSPCANCKYYDLGTRIDRLWYYVIVLKKNCKKKSNFVHFFFFLLASRTSLCTSWTDFFLISGISLFLIYLILIFLCSIFKHISQTYTLSHWIPNTNLFMGFIHVNLILSIYNIYIHTSAVGRFYF